VVNELGCHAYLRKKRKHPAITKTSKIFSEYLKNKDYENSARIVFWCVLQVMGVDGFMMALDHANSVIRRKELLNKKGV